LLLYWLLACILVFKKCKFPIITPKYCRLTGEKGRNSAERRREKPSNYIVTGDAMCSGTAVQNVEGN